MVNAIVGNATMNNLPYDIVCCAEHKWGGQPGGALRSYYKQLYYSCNNCSALKIHTRHDVYDTETNKLTFHNTEVVVEPDGTTSNRREWKEDWCEKPPRILFRY
jgi:hypothetical protein